MESSTAALQGAEGCSSSESGWTAYIASPNQEQDHSVSEEEDYSSVSVQDCKKIADDDGEEEEEEEEDAEEVDSDDSMASDASSGPSHQGHLYGNREEKKHVVMKQNRQEQKKKHHMQIKADKEKSVHRADPAGRSNKI